MGWKENDSFDAAIVLVFVYCVTWYDFIAIQSAGNIIWAIKRLCGHLWPPRLSLVYRVPRLL